MIFYKGFLPNEHGLYEIHYYQGKARIESAIVTRKARLLKTHTSQEVNRLFRGFNTSQRVDINSKNEVFSELLWLCHLHNDLCQN